MFYSSTSTSAPSDKISFGAQLREAVARSAQQRHNRQVIKNIVTYTCSIFLAQDFAEITLSFLITNLVLFFYFIVASASADDDNNSNNNDDWRQRLC